MSDEKMKIHMGLKKKEEVVALRKVTEKIEKEERKTKKNYVPRKFIEKPKFSGIDLEALRSVSGREKKDLVKKLKVKYSSDVAESE